MVGRRAYDAMYRWWAPWDRVGVRDDLRALVEAGTVTSASHPRTIDLGCGTGANVVYLAASGFDVTGVDFSPVALRKARTRAEEAGAMNRCRFVEADLTQPLTEAVGGPFDLLVDFGTLDDLDAPGRAALARTVTDLARPGALFLFWCFYAARDQLPWISFSGPSRTTPAVEPGEEQRLFGEGFTIERFGQQGQHVACFLLRRKAEADQTPGTSRRA